MTLVVRRARPDDLAAAAEVTLAAYRGVFADDELGDYASLLADTAGRAAGAELVVAVAGGHVAGTVTYVADGGPWAEISRPGEAEFRMLAVDPARQGAGIGRALVAHVVASARAAGRSALVLSSSERMTAAHRLYESLGFRRTPELDWQPPKHGARLVTYRLDLGDWSVRPVRAGEHDAVGDMLVTTYSAVHLHPEYAARLRQVGERARTTSTVVAATPEGELLGTVAYVPGPGPQSTVARDGEAEFRTLAVAESARHRGVGQALVTWCVGRARAEGAVRVVLSTMPWMTAAHRMYERMGFTRTPERDWSPRAGYTCETYALDL